MGNMYGAYTAAEKEPVAAKYKSLIVPDSMRPTLGALLIGDVTPNKQLAKQDLMSFMSDPNTKIVMDYYMDVTLSDRKANDITDTAAQAAKREADYNVIAKKYDTPEFREALNSDAGKRMTNIMSQLQSVSVEERRSIMCNLRQVRSSVNTFAAFSNGADYPLTGPLYDRLSDLSDRLSGLPLSETNVEFIDEKTGKQVFGPNVIKIRT